MEKSQVQDIFAEAEEEIREDKFYSYARKIAIIFAVCAIVLIATVTSYDYINSSRQERNEEEANHFIQILELGNTGSEQLIEFASHAKDSYGAMAYIIAANTSLQAGNGAEFEKSMKRVIDGNYDVFFQDIAGLNLINYYLDKNPDKAEEYLTKVQMEKSLLKRLFILAKASLFIQKSQNDKAGEELQKLLDDNLTPAHIRKLASNLLKTLDSNQKK